MRRILVFVLLLAASGAAGAAPEHDDMLTVLVTILPHAGLVEHLAGDQVRVHVLVGQDQSPETYQPTPRELQAIAASRVWFTTGTPIETMLRGRLTAMMPDLEVVPTHASLEPLADHHCAHHDHDHDHGDLDPHVWVSPRNTAVQAAVMAAALRRHLPGQAESIDAAEASLLADLAAIDTELTALLEPVRGRTFFVFHPAFGYFARDYGLRQEAVESGGQAPSPRRLTELLRSVRDQGARAVYVQPQQSVAAVAPLAREAALEVIVLDPLAPDHLANLRHIGAVLRAGLEPQP